MRIPVPADEAVELPKPRAAAARPALGLVGPETRAFEKLAGLIADTSEQYRPEHQLKAYILFVSLHANAAADDGATQAEWNSVAASAIGAEAKRLQSEAAANCDDALAACFFYETLTAFQENIVFQCANIKLPDQPVAPVDNSPSDRGPMTQDDLLPIYVQTVLKLFTAVPLPGV